MNIVIEIKAPDLASAIQSLAEALKTSNVKIDEPKTIEPQAQPEQQITSPTPAIPTSPPVQTAQPQAQPEQTQPIPTQAPTYTMDQLAVAATQLMDAGKRNELIQLLQSFGVQTLTALPQEQYGAFATKLRELGAKI